MMRPSAAMPLAYPFGAGQPLGCRISGPPDVLADAAGTTLSVGVLVGFTGNAPAISLQLSFRSRPRRGVAGGHLPQREALQLSGLGLGQLRDELDRTRVFVRRD